MVSKGKRPPKPKKPKGIYDTYMWFTAREDGVPTFDPVTGVELGKWVLG